MTNVQEEVSALAHRWSEWSKLHDGKMEWTEMTQGQWKEVVELEESYQDLEAQFNIASALLDMDGRELDDPLRHVGNWT
ncbi:hypothetical protein V6N13_020124 [Hibiscus sabdariffa]|uniref:Uncharacterized protein n=1 Tax=Hibiscus sabdariffa TaxID=183260 RepID=A0ABR2EUF9_9ROSI